MTASTGIDRQTYEGWGLGFASGAGYAEAFAGSSIAETDAEGAMAWVAKYCAEHHTLPNAAVDLVVELSETGPVKALDVTPVEDAKAP